MLPPDVLVIGVDGGASNVRALAVRTRDDGLLEPAGARAERAHEPFEATAIALQKSEAGPTQDSRPAGEIVAARARVHATAEAIVEAAQDSKRIALGICMPGLKTADGRGIAILRNGPRSPRFLDDLEEELRSRGVQLAAPIPPLLGDGVAGTLGERRAAGGGLRDVDDAYWLAGGTGLAEAFLIAGRARSLDEFPGVKKAWAMESTPGIAYEDGLSMGGWSRRWWSSRGKTQRNPLPVHVEELALRGDTQALDILQRAGKLLGHLCVDRVERLRKHAGIELRCAVVGGHLGRLLARPDLAPFLREPAECWLPGSRLRFDFLRASTLTDAAALGAAAFALDREGDTCSS